ncbi:MAG: DUF4340 domain-containing protein [Candidatus Krumholzibacteriia bacterium]
MRSNLVKLAGIILALLMGLLLWRWSAPADQDRGLHGGPMFSFKPAAVERLEVRRALGTDVLVREPGGWRLEGQVEDLVDAERMDTALAVLVEADAFPVLPGTEPDARRFGFGGEGAIELIFHLAGGGRERLALGDVAPVSDQIYASGAGRRGVFGVGGGLYAVAVRLPDSVRLPRLLPPLTLADVDSLTLGRRDGASWRFRRGADGRWWCRLEGGVADLAGLAAAYHTRFTDRRLAEPDGTWVQADRRRLADLVFRATDTAVTGFVPAAGATPDLLADYGLLPAYRTLDLHQGPDTWSVAFGELQEADRVMARRQRALVITRAEALAPAEGFLGEFLDLTALGYRLADADSLHVDEPDRPLLWGRRAPDPRARFEARQSGWDAAVPPGWTLTFGAETTANHIDDLQVTLDRLGMIDLLPTSAVDPLAAEPRWRVRGWFGDGSVREAWLGRHRVTGQPVLWAPATGRVAVVDEVMLVTLRSLRADLREAG